MAQESFSDSDTAKILNERFVSIKVDCEERPDINTTYMRAVRAMTNRGGWPMSVFLTPDGKPFYAGSYFPKNPRPGLPSFEQVLVAVSTAWHQKPAEVTATVEQLCSALLAETPQLREGDVVDLTAADDAARLILGRVWDRRHGGFGAAPKFPHAMVIEWLLHRFARTGDLDALNASTHTLREMMHSGIHDHLGGGFYRYTIDEGWQRPHFEKMLYDNALLLPAYATAAVLTGEPDFRGVAQATARYLLSNLRADNGAFASAIDADAAGVEGGYYTWYHDELIEALDDIGVDPEPWSTFLGAPAVGHSDCANVLRWTIAPERFAEQLRLTRAEWDSEWERVRHQLLTRRAKRVAPQVEDRVLTDWSALAVRGLVRAGLLLDERSWIDAAVGSATFLHEHLVVRARPRHVWKEGRAAVDGFLLDYTALALADLELFQATGDPVWFDRGLRLATMAHERFNAGEGLGWMQTSRDAEALFTDQKEIGDVATPAGSSVMVEVCLLLAGLTGDDVWKRHAENGIRLSQDDARRNPLGYGWLLRQLEALAAGPQEIAVIGRPGADRDALTRAVVGLPRPGTVTVIATPDHDGTVPLLAGRGEIDGRPAAYVCRDHSCEHPVTTSAALDAQLRRG